MTAHNESIPGIYFIVIKIYDTRYINQRYNKYFLEEFFFNTFHQNNLYSWKKIIKVQF